MILNLMTMNNSIKDRALKILGSRNMSASDMEKRLIEKGESPENAAETVRWLIDIGAIDDENYAQQIVSHYCAKGYGIYRIKDELYRRGIPRDMWDEALEKIQDSDESALKFLDKKLKGSSDKTEIRRAMDALCRRGFSRDDAQRFIRQYIESIDETEDAHL